MSKEQKVYILERADGGQLVLDEGSYQTVQQLAERERKTMQEVVEKAIQIGAELTEEWKVLKKKWNDLHLRKKEVTALSCLQLSDEQIAKRLNVPVAEVRNHLKEIFVIFHAQNKRELMTTLRYMDFSKWKHYRYFCGVRIGKPRMWFTT